MNMNTLSRVVVEDGRAREEEVGTWDEPEIG